MKINYFSLSSFANPFAKYNEKSGNLLAVVLNADSLTINQMQLISKKINYSETAFILTSNIANYKVLFFTPNKQIDICGHATIGVFSFLNKTGQIKTGKYTQESNNKIYEIEVCENGFIFMKQDNPVFYEYIDKKEISESLNINESDIIFELKPQIVSTGLKDIIIPVKSLKILHSIKPDFKRIIEISKKYDVIGYHVFSLETLFNSTAHCRNFAPLYDIYEESATGTSNGALACYLFKEGKLLNRNLNNLIFEQGYIMNSSSLINAKIDSENDILKSIWVGGKTINIKHNQTEI